MDAGFKNVLEMRGGSAGDEMGRLSFPGWAVSGLPSAWECIPTDPYEKLAKKARASATARSPGQFL